ncbi:unnamed protein product, partial [Mesorhabditis belari]|uniref:Uncharacterized protein n=1 Tax=Mesorhabditis belari TaxID=2138241 RepID=A0AAF3EAP6_9BILA
MERPIKNHSEALEVKIRTILQQVVDVDEKNQLVQIVLWVQLTWKDYKMKWDPKEYGGIIDVQLPPGTLWKPDILLFNSADEHFDALFPVNFVVDYEGNVLMSPPSIVKISCNIDLTHFPFDDQICYLKYGSWTYTGHKVDIVVDTEGLNPPHSMDLHYYVPNGEWSLLSTPSHVDRQEFFGKKYVEVYFYLHLKRRTLYYGLNWIIPSLLISLSNVLGFALPPECGEKITVQITNLLSVLVFLGMVSNVTPPTSESIPVIVAFFTASLLILGLSVITTTLTITIHFRNPKTRPPMGPLLSLIFLEWLPWFLMMERPGKKFARPPQLQGCRCETFEDIREKSHRGSSITSKNIDSKSSTEESERLKASSEDLIEETNWTENPRYVIPQYSLDECTPMEISLREIADNLKFIRKKFEEEEAEEEEESDWKFMAMALDRFFLFLFTGAYIFISLAMVIATPRIFDQSVITVKK